MCFTPYREGVEEINSIPYVSSAQALHSKPIGQTP